MKYTPIQPPDIEDMVDKDWAKRLMNWVIWGNPKPHKSLEVTPNTHDN